MSSGSCVLCVSRTNFQAGGARSRSCAVAVRMHDYCCPGDIVYRGSHTLSVNITPAQVTICAMDGLSVNMNTAQAGGMRAGSAGLSVNMTTAQAGGMRAGSAGRSGLATSPSVSPFSSGSSGLFFLLLNRW